MGTNWGIGYILRHKKANIDEMGIPKVSQRCAMTFGEIAFIAFKKI